MEQKIKKYWTCPYGNNYEVILSRLLEQENCPDNENNGGDLMELKVVIDPKIDISKSLIAVKCEILKEDYFKILDIIQYTKYNCPEDILDELGKEYLIDNFAKGKKLIFYRTYCCNKWTRQNFYILSSKA